MEDDTDLKAVLAKLKDPSLQVTTPAPEEGDFHRAEALSDDEARLQLVREKSREKVCLAFVTPYRGDKDLCGNCGATAAEHDLDNPFGKPEECRDCTLFREPGPVPAVGPQDAKIQAFGEAPGAEEVDFPNFRPARFKPFIGGSGRLLSSLLSHAGIDRKEVRITNVVKCRPPNNRIPTPLEIRCCAPFLIDEIEKGASNLLLALGETPLSVLTDKKKIGLWRGVPVEGFDNRKVFPTWHPSFIARSQHNWPFAVHDLVRAQAESAFPEIRRIPYDIVRDANSARDREPLLAAARLRGACTFDFETTGLSPQRDSIVMVGLMAQADKAHVFNWSASTRALFQEILDDPRIEIIGQNVLNFDLPFAEEKGLNIPWHKIFDTMVAFHLVNASYGQTSIAEQDAKTFRVRGAEKDLAFIASNHTDLPYWKSRDDYKTDLKGVCGIDCVATDRSALHPVSGIKAELRQYGMEDLYWKHVLPVHPILKRMTKAGVRINKDKAAEWGLGLTMLADRLEAEFKQEVGDPFLNLNSPIQMRVLLYEKLRLPVQYVTDRKGTRPTANADALQALAQMFPKHAILKSLVEIRHYRKMKSTYVDPGLEGDGWLHPKFGVSKAATGRFNSWDPNAQNVPEEMREIWIPDDDEHVLFSADWSQIEWRLAMVLSGDPVGLALLASGVDNHKAVAAETLGKRVEDITEAERYSAKFIVYGLGYGRGADSIADGHGLPIDFVRQFISRFLDRFRVFARWRDRNVDFVKKNHYLANPFNRRRWWYTHQVTEVYNFPQQSTAADQMYKALIALARELPPTSTLRLTVHDEVVVHAPKDDVRRTAECIRENMERQWPEIVQASADPAEVRKHYPNGWHIPVDLGVGTDWMMCKTKDKEKKAERLALIKHLGLENL